MGINNITYQAKASILIVDDNSDNLKLLFKYLNNECYEVFIAQSGAKALQIASSIRIDLIILDIMMPVMDGFETCRKLKNNVDTQSISVIFMTALTDSKDKIKSFQMGAVDYITKPIERGELLARISTHINLQNYQRRLNQKAQVRKLLFGISNRISDCIRNSLDPKTIFQTIAQDIIEVLQCDRLILARLNDNNVLIESQFVVSPELFKLPSKLKLSYFHQEQLGKIQSIKENWGQQDTKAKLFAPIFLGENTLGNISSKSNAQQKNESNLLWGWLVVEHLFPQDWSEEVMELCQNITAQFAIAINQKLLHQKIIQSNQELKQINAQLSQTSQKFKQLALLDPLTEVFNRRYLDRQLNTEWYRLRRDFPERLSIIMCDVDCFKTYNDTYGHQQGDRCLQQIASAIQNVLKRPADMLARYGGEEFVVVLPHTDQAGAIKLAESIRAMVQNLGLTHVNSTVDSVVTISLGVASAIPDATNKPEFIIEAADQALYKAKNRGRNCLAVYEGDISQSKESRSSETQWVRRIRQAMARDLFSLYAQPITSLELNSNSPEHFEILLRLTDCEDVIISPNAFFDIAARHSLMPEIDMWVVNNLLKKLEKIDRQDLLKYHFSINLSGASLNSESFWDFLWQKLSNVHFSAEIFCFEITETEAISNLARVSKFIDLLKTLGCSFALDDFGKGLSSLSYLKNLPVDYLKIDGSFITELNKDRASMVMVEAINHIAAGIGLKTVAEFVESQAILNTVRNLKVDYAQGYHLGHPKELTSVLNQISKVGDEIHRF